jgi:hypothetical protein
MGAGTIFPGVKEQGGEIDPSHSLIAEVKNCGAITPLPHMPSWFSV